MVNFHACRLYIENNGGFTLTTPHLDGFKCTAFVMGARKKDMPELRRQWAYVTSDSLIHGVTELLFRCFVMLYLTAHPTMTPPHPPVLTYPRIRPPPHYTIHTTRYALHGTTAPH